MIVLDKYQEVNSIYRLTAKQTYMHTGLTIDQFIKQLSSSKRIDIKTIKAFERLFGINFKFFKRPSFINQGLNMEYPFTEKYIIDQEKIYLLYAHYFGSYDVIMDKLFDNKHKRADKNVQFI